MTTVCSKSDNFNSELNYYKERYESTLNELNSTKETNKILQKGINELNEANIELHKQNEKLQEKLQDALWIYKYIFEFLKNQLYNNHKNTNKQHRKRYDAYGEKIQFVEYYV